VFKNKGTVKTGNHKQNMIDIILQLVS